MGKGLYAVFRTKQDLERHDAEIRHHTRVWQMDYVTIALGCMGFRETKFREFDKVLAEVVKEYMTDHLEDYKDDKEMVYSRNLVERELKQYVGKMYAPEEERYR